MRRIRKLLPRKPIPVAVVCVCTQNCLIVLFHISENKVVIRLMPACSNRKSIVKSLKYPHSVVGKGPVDKRIYDALPRRIGFQPTRRS